MSGCGRELCERRGAGGADGTDRGRGEVSVADLWQRDGDDRAEQRTERHEDAIGKGSARRHHPRDEDHSDAHDGDEAAGLQHLAYDGLEIARSQSYGWSMFTWFQRGDEYLRYEAREISSGDYELTILTSDGTETVERFSDQEALSERQVALQRELEAEDWTGPHGWNL
jgi:hypothetical protein